jgi:hypothetical protein
MQRQGDGMQRQGDSIHACPADLLLAAVSLPINQTASAHPHSRNRRCGKNPHWHLEALYGHGSA